MGDQEELDYQYSPLEDEVSLAMKALEERTPAKTPSDNQDPESLRIKAVASSEEIITSYLEEIKQKFEESLGAMDSKIADLDNKVTNLVTLAPAAGVPGTSGLTATSYSSILPHEIGQDMEVDVSHEPNNSESPPELSPSTALPPANARSLNSCAHNLFKRPLQRSLADGGKLPPLVIFKGAYVWDDWQPSKEDVYPGLTYAATKNGWIETDVFELFFLKTFISSLKGERPALIVCDGHETHVSLNLVEMARKENIHILLLPPHPSHILEPLDLCVMKSLKSAWDPQLVKWQKHHIGKKLPKREFVKLLSTLWTNVEPSLVKSAFEKAGVVPFDREQIPETMFDPSALKRYKTEISKDKT
ncbi:hypothetical protein GE061_015552 [Apolygus lucorum]|uniref:DDE-1 domain-containing protein n=1 Tax=Apolygus lucorum TaxID=248454 RepID=A0A8S9XL96_APOLU|nr:hypothetical protein GE061_015552 [Apolygus lucorum]